MSVDVSRSKTTSHVTLKERSVVKYAVLVFALTAVGSRRVLAQEPTTAASGRYQLSTAYRDAGNWVFVTVIDTTTGRVVTRERYNGFKQYSEVP